MVWLVVGWGVCGMVGGRVSCGRWQGVWCGWW